MAFGIRLCLSLSLALSITALAILAPAAQTPNSEETKKPSIAVSGEMDDVMRQEAAKVKEELALKARSLFERKPLGWDQNTIRYLYRETLSFPAKVPEIIRFTVEQSRVLGFVGSVVVFLFIAAILYSLLGQRRVLRWVEQSIQPLSRLIPESAYPFFLSGIKVFVSALIPLLLLGLYELIHAMIDYRAKWFEFSGDLLALWTVWALVQRLLKETLTRDLLPGTSEYGPTIYRWARMALLLTAFGMAVFWAVDAFHLRKDVLALLRFAISVSVTAVLLMLLLHKKAFMSLLPELPYRPYQRFRDFVAASYYLLLIISFIAALLWCFGYRTLGSVVLFKIWFTGAALVAVVFLHHALVGSLKAWSEGLDSRDEAAQLLVRSLRTLLVYVTVLAAVVIVLDLLGLFNPLRRLMSFPIFEIEATSVTLWVIFKAILIILAFVFVSRLAQAYLDYKVYPAIGVDPGLGYALNTFFKYVSLAVGVLIAINIVGINLRFLLVFAGAIGIGIGLGLQNMAANVIAGFTIIFGGKIRKGDWIEVNNTLGVVTDIYLRATKLRTRDSIEYLVPNSNLISNTIVNYSLSSPLIRIAIPVGVSYDADPREVEQILLEVAEKEPMVEKVEKPVVRFVEYADSSINFELLVWIDVRETPRRKIRSALYYAIFSAFDKAGITIPFPQRDIHIRSDSAAG